MLLHHEVGVKFCNNVETSMKKLQYRPLILSVNIWPQRGSSINQGIKRSILYLLYWSRRFRGCYEIKAPPWDVSARMRASGTTHAAHSLAVKSAKGRKNTFTFFGQILFLPPSFLPSSPVFATSPLHEMRSLGSRRKPLC